MAGQVLEHDWFEEPLPENVRIGEGSWVYSSFAFRHYRSRRGVVIGRHSGVYNGSFLDLGPEGQVQIGDYCSIVGATFATNGRVVVEDYAFIAHEVTIADRHAAVPGSGPGGDQASPEILIGENAWIGARAVILAGTRLGPNCVVGAATVVDFDVPPGAVVAGSPARIVRRAAGG